MTNISPGSKYLSTINISFTEYTHPEKANSIEEAATQRNQTLNQVIRSILFRLDKERFVLILIAGKKQIDWKKIRKYFKVSRLTTASPDEVLNITGYKVGSVGPFGLINDLEVFIDQRVTDTNEISIGSGIRGTTLIMKTKELLKAIGENATIGDFATDR